ncbi:hypothetical protein Pint_12168 [Pistacia integerrima]|uniref:Uncharacterized protein n=1 Tax=Pistacia integerrima TaxID=434235 RepID=A0ACC0XH31_9ROSI|nr:hypothetical protein Pint_12168 [Pistacia integerrima]
MITFRLGSGRKESYPSHPTQLFLSSYQLLSSSLPINYQLFPSSFLGSPSYSDRVENSLTQVIRRSFFPTDYQLFPSSLLFIINKAEAD